MTDEIYQEEYEELYNQKRQQFISWRLIIIAAIVLGFFYLWSNAENSVKIWMVVLSVVGFLIYWYQKDDENSFVTKPVAKRIARETIEEEKENLDIEEGANIQTNNCRLERISGDPYEWHVGVNVETRNHKIEYYRIDIDPYRGKVIGRAKLKSEFKGDEIPDTRYVRPRYGFEEE